MLLDEEFQGNDKSDAQQKEKEKVLSRRERPDLRHPGPRKLRAKNGPKQQRTSDRN
ncbi:MAG: hypothetical protein WBP85_12710 [Terracidiphilus sp.]